MTQSGAGGELEKDGPRYQWLRDNGIRNGAVAGRSVFGANRMKTPGRRLWGLLMLKSAFASTRKTLV